MDVITYNTALYAAGAYGSWRGALALLEEMQQVSYVTPILQLLTVFSNSVLICSFVCSRTVPRAVFLFM
jgi:pentatricopeptide repeat protein